MAVDSYGDGTLLRYCRTSYERHLSLCPGFYHSEYLDPLTSVTNGYGQVHGVTGLYVADNSVIPTIGASNPTLTSIALAIRTADHMMRVEGG